MKGGSLVANESALQQGWALNATEDFITRTYVLPLLTDERSRERLVDEHRKNPIGVAGKGGKPGTGHSTDLVRVLDKFRRAPQAGKYCRVCTKPHEEWRIGIFSGIRGEPIKILPEAFASEDDCEHAIFLKRIDDLLEAYRRNR